MGRSVNKVILVGNVGKEPEITTINSGDKVAKFSIATSESYKDKAGEWIENTEWHNIECWKYLAETTEKYLQKGSKVYIEGKLKTDSYDKNGVRMYSTKIVASQLVLLDKSEQEQAPKKDNFKNPSDQPSQSDLVQEDDMPF